MSRYQKILCAIFAAIWVWATINPVFPHDWLLENYLVFIFVPLIIITGRYFKLSNVSYTLFSFGFLLAYPIREIFVRITRVKGFWGYYLPLDVTLSFSAIYEIIEWLAVLNVGSAAGIAFLGAQGDIWDAQKDMLVAGLGALLAMLIIFMINWKYNKHFMQELKESFKISANDAPLGEVKLKEMIDGK
ncbi:MAG: hypothetical protein UW71_C0036G0006 [Parcubacteria group bacterium GW2011_GWB1_44_7]|nr:MAG: hypothetical protein UW71_C0036G0006 [Parcubacteria group bacterium GW2011_GWB1_44_7]